MRFVYFIFYLVLAVTSVAQDDDPTVLKPKPEDTVQPEIIFPMVPVLDQKDIAEEDSPVPFVPPKPKPGPKFVSSLSEDTLLVIESTLPLLVYDFPEGLVSVEADDGARPMKVKSKFADGTGKMESRTFTSKYLYFVEALKKGEVEMLIIPEGAISKSQSQRHKIVVMGQAPNPPPTPDPDPDPDVDPTPEPPAPVKSFRVIFVKESGMTLNADQSAIPGAKVIREYLNTKTTKSEDGSVGWREYDPQEVTNNEPPLMKLLWETVKPKLTPAPCMVIEINGHATVAPFPTNAAEAMVALKKAGGE